MIPTPDDGEPDLTVEVWAGEEDTDPRYGAVKITTDLPPETVVTALRQTADAIEAGPGPFARQNLN